MVITNIYAIYYDGESIPINLDQTTFFELGEVKRSIYYRDNQSINYLVCRYAVLRVGGEIKYEEISHFRLGYANGKTETIYLPQTKPQYFDGFVKWVAR